MINSQSQVADDGRVYKLLGEWYCRTGQIKQMVFTPESTEERAVFAY